MTNMFKNALQEAGSVSLQKKWAPATLRLSGAQSAAHLTFLKHCFIWNSSMLPWIHSLRITKRGHGGVSPVYLAVNYRCTDSQIACMGVIGRGGATCSTWNCHDCTTKALCAVPVSPRDPPRCARLRPRPPPAFIRLLPHSSAKKRQQEPPHDGDPCSFVAQPFPRLLKRHVASALQRPPERIPGDAALLARRGRAARNKPQMAATVGVSSPSRVQTIGQDCYRRAGHVCRRPPGWISTEMFFFLLMFFFSPEQASVSSRDVTLRAPVVSLPHSCS